MGLSTFRLVGPIGRNEYLARIIVLPILWAALHFAHSKVSNGLAYGVISVCMALLFWELARSEYGRLLDAKRSRWLLALSALLPAALLGPLVVFKVVDGRVALALFILAQLPFAFLPASGPGPNDLSQPR